MFIFLGGNFQSLSLKKQLEVKLLSEEIEPYLESYLIKNGFNIWDRETWRQDLWRGEDKERGGGEN